MPPMAASAHLALPLVLPLVLAALLGLGATSAWADEPPVQPAAAPPPAAASVVAACPGSGGGCSGCCARPPAREFILGLPIWIPSVAGTFASGSTSVDVDRPPEAGVTDSKVITEFEFAFVGGLDARWGRFVVYTDLFTVKVKNTADFQLNALDAEGSLSAFIARALAGWRVIQAPCANRPWSLDLDILAGARFYIVEAELKEPAALAFSRDESWIDPLVAVRAHLDLPGRFGLLATADMGGFGVGSELSMSASLDVRYCLSRSWMLSLGYGWLSVDYDLGVDDDRFIFDIDIHGPRLVLEYRF